MALFPNLNCNLESVKTPRLRHLNLSAKSFNLTTHTTSMQAAKTKISFLLTKFSLTIPSLAAKNAKTCLIKCCSSG